MEEKKSLNGIWEFKIDPEKKGITEKWMEKSDFGDDSWKKIVIPSALELMDKEHLFDFSGDIWLWRQITVSKELEDRRMMICCNRIAPLCEIYIDGKSVGVQNIHDASINVKLPKLTVEKPIPLMIRLFGLDQREKTGPHQWVGILEDISLRMVGALQFDNFRLQAYPKDNYTKAHVDFHFDVTSTFNVDVYAQIAVRVIGSGKEIFSKLENFKSVKESNNHVIVAFDLDNPHLWNLNDPYLYNLEVKLNRTNQIQDNFTTYFGIREFMFRDHRLFINGKSVPLIGLQYLVDYPGCGMVLPSGVIAQDIHQMKKLGINLLFTKGTFPELFFHFADSMGMILIEQITQENLLPTVKRDARFPSLLGWTKNANINTNILGNEFGSNLLFLNLSNDPADTEPTPKMITIDTPAQLTAIKITKVPRILLLNNPAITGVSTLGVLPFVTLSEDAQLALIQQSLKLVEENNQSVSGVILADWADESADAFYRNPHTGIINATRTQGKKSFHFLFNQQQGK